MKNDETNNTKSVLSQQDIKAINKALYYTQVREGSFASTNPLGILSGQISNMPEPISLKDFSQTELALLLKSVRENIKFMATYDYGPIDGEFSEKLRSDITDPLKSLDQQIGKLISI